MFRAWLSAGSHALKVTTTPRSGNSSDDCPVRSGMSTTSGSGFTTGGAILDRLTNSGAVAKTLDISTRTVRKYKGL